MAEFFQQGSGKPPQTLQQGASAPTYTELVERVEQLEQQQEAVELKRLPMSDVTKWLESNWEPPIKQMTGRAVDSGYRYDELEAPLANQALALGVPVTALHGSGAAIQVTFTAETTERWTIEGVMLSYTAAAAWSGISAQLRLNGTVYAENTHHGIGGFADYQTHCPKRSVVLPAGAYVLTLTGLVFQGAASALYRAGVTYGPWVAAYRSEA